MALSRCALAHRGADWYVWRTPAIACVAAQPSRSWHRPGAGQATGRPCQRPGPDGCIDTRLHPVTTTAIRHAQVPDALMSVKAFFSLFWKLADRGFAEIRTR